MQKDENNQRNFSSYDPERFAEIMSLVLNTSFETFRGASVNALQSAGDTRLELGRAQHHTCRFKLICRGK